MTDWLTAFDDLLVHRWHTCTLCGQRPVIHGGIWEVNGRSVAFTFCRQHVETMRASEQDLAVLFQARYGRETL